MGFRGRSPRARVSERRGWAAAVAGVLLVGAAWAAPAAAQEGAAAQRLLLRAVDSTSEQVELLVSYSGGLDALGELAVEENGAPVDVTVTPVAEAGGRTVDVAFVFDVSVSTDANALLASAREAVEPVLADLPPNTRAAVIATGNASQTLVGLTADAGRLDDALGDLTPGGEGGLASGIIRAANIVGDRDDGGVPAVVLLTDGVEDPTTSLQLAESELLDSGVPLFVVGLQDGALDEGAFGTLADETGGQLRVATEAGQIAGLVDEVVPSAVDVAVATYESSESAGVQDLVLTVGEASIQASYVSGSVMVGANRLGPRPAIEPDGISFFHGDAGRYLGFGAALAACVLFAYGVLLLFVRERTALSQALQPYADGFVSGDEPQQGDDAMAQTAFLQRAVAMTEGFAERQGGLITKLEKKLEQADLPLRAGEALFFYLAGVVLVLVATLALTGNLLGMLVVTGLVALVPPAVLNFLATRKRKQFEALLPDTLQLLASTLRAGYSMMQGVEAVSQEAAEPMGKELRRVVTEARLGRPLEESLDAIASRMQSGDFAWAVMAIRIQREVGGNLAELLMTVAETMTERERLRRDISALTAEGRISAYVLIGLPIGLGLFLWSVNQEYVGKLFDVTMGQLMLGAALVAMVAGYAWMMKIIKIEI